MRKVAARRVVLANGRDGLGGPYTPDLFRGLDPRFVMHSLGDIDFCSAARQDRRRHRRRRDRCDSAAEALEHGAARAAMLVRRADVPRINKGMGIGSAGFWVGFHSLADAQKWRDRELHRRPGGAAAAQLDAALSRAAQELFHSGALRAARRRSPRRPRAARHHARQACIRLPHSGDRPRGGLEPAAGIRGAQAARPALARSFHARGARRLRAGGPSLSRRRTSSFSNASRRRALGEPHPLLQLCGLL